MDEADEKRSFTLTAPRGFLATLVFVLLAILFEILLVYSFIGLGLMDNSTLVVNLGVFAFVISPLFEFLPVTVIVVLFCSWVYLTKYSTYVPPRPDFTRKPMTRRELERRRFKGLRRFSRRIERRFQGFSSSVFNGVHLDDAAVRSGLMVFFVFLALSLLVSVVAFPDLIYNTVVGMFMGNPFFLGFVRGTTTLAQGFGDALAGVLIVVAPGFHSGLDSSGEALTGSIVSLDSADKYLLSQNIATWASALLALGYGIYASTRRQKRR